jgi:hypothetical protein
MPIPQALDLSDEQEKSIAAYLWSIKDYRKRILAARVHKMKQLYPEVSNLELQWPTDYEILELALNREMNHQKQVAKDLEKD